MTTTIEPAPTVYGPCPVCHESFALRKDGTLRSHNRRTARSVRHCTGSRRAPEAQKTGSTAISFSRNPGDRVFIPVRAIDLGKGDAVALVLSGGGWHPESDQNKLPAAVVVRVKSVADLRNAAANPSDIDANARVMMRTDVGSFNVAALAACWKVEGETDTYVPPTPADPDPRRRVRSSGYYTRLYGSGLCDACKRRFTLRADGTLRRHQAYDEDEVGVFAELCPGSELPPAPNSVVKKS